MPLVEVQINEHRRAWIEHCSGHDGAMCTEPLWVAYESTEL